MNKSFSIIISNNQRSIEYLSVFKKLKKSPKKIIYINDKKNPFIKNKIAKIISKNKIFKKKKIFYSKNLSESVAKYLLLAKEKNFIISLPHGEIIKNKNLLIKKNLIHFHPGRLPLFRGATSIYYSILKKKEISCSAIIMSINIDGGDVLFHKKFSFPKKFKDIDKKFDIEMRKVCLKYLINNFNKIKAKPQKKIKKLHYYLAHPIIRKLAVMRMKS